jgi:predicted acyl esterase
MTTVAKNKMYPDVHNAENWKYTTTNNIKTFNNKDDAKRFISGTSKIWKLENYKNGTTFTQSLLQSIDEIHQSNTAGFEYADENGDVCYILFLIQVSPDGKSLQISHTQHKLSRSGARRNAVDNVNIEECNAGRWLMQRACNELHLPEQATEAMMSSKTNTIENRTAKYSLQEHSLSQKEINEITNAIHSTSDQNENYCSVHKSRCQKRFLHSIQEIANFSTRISDSDQFLDRLVEQIQNVRTPKEFLHQLQYSDGEKCTLTILVRHENNLIHLLTQLQIGGVRS